MLQFPEESIIDAKVDRGMIIDAKRLSKPEKIESNTQKRNKERHAKKT